MHAQGSIGKYLISVIIVINIDHEHMVGPSRLMFLSRWMGG